MSTYTKINLVARPAPGPITADLFEIVTEEIPTAGPGQILVKQTHMSLDPAMIGWIKDRTGSFAGGLYFVAGLLMLSAVLTLVLSSTQKSKAAAAQAVAH